MSEEVKDRGPAAGEKPEETPAPGDVLNLDEVLEGVVQRTLKAKAEEPPARAQRAGGPAPEGEDDDLPAVKSAETEDVDAVAEAVITKLAEREEERRAAEKARAEERAAVKAELMAELRQEGALKAPDLPFEFQERMAEGQELEPAVVQQMISPYDRLHPSQLAIRYYIGRKAAATGMTAPPSTKFRRALALKAREFLKEEVELKSIDPYDGSIKSRKVSTWELIQPVLRPWPGSTAESHYVDGVGEVAVKDNISPEGVKTLQRISAMNPGDVWNKFAGIKSDELIYSTQAGFGDEWVPTLMAATLWRTIRLEARTLQLFDQFDMPSNPFQQPVEGSDPTIYGVSEATDENQLVIGANMPIGDSKVGTSNITYSAGKLGAISFWSEEMAEDAIIATEPQLRDQYGLAMAHGIDDVLVNGDETTNTQNISNWGTSLAATHRYLQIDGLRHEALVTTTADSRDGGALTHEDVTATRKLMGTRGVFGARNEQLAILVDLPTGYTFEDLDEVITVDKFGSGATILTGMLGSIKGIPIVKLQDYPLTDANGRIDDTAGNNTKGSFLVVNHRMVRIGWRRRPRIVVGQIPFSDAWYILVLTRLDLGFQQAGGVGLNYNVTV